MKSFKEHMEEKAEIARFIEIHDEWMVWRMSQIDEEITPEIQSKLEEEFKTEWNTAFEKWQHRIP